MGYRIEYNAMEIKQEKKRRKPEWNWMMAAACVIGIVVGLSVCGMGREIWELLIPGSNDVTKAALAQMLEDLRGGESIGYAFSVFCREIIAGELME